MQKNKSITVFLSSVGATNAVNVMKALRVSALDVRIIGGDCNSLSAGLYLADKGYVMPKVDNPKFMPKVFEICEKEKVNIALPIYSADFPVFEQHKIEFEYKGIKTYAPSAESWDICNSKYRVIKHLESIGVPCPKVWTIEEALVNRSALTYPLFIKLNSGSGTKNVKVIRTPHDLEYYARPEFVVQEYINGEEYTVDVLSGLKGEVIVISPRKRLKISGGLSVCGITIKNKEICRFTKQIVESLSLPGPSNVQCKMANGIPVFYDINPRFASGGLPLAVAAGVNMPELLVRMLMDWKIPRRIRPKAGVTMFRYWDSLFIEKGARGIT